MSPSPTTTCVPLRIGSLSGSEVFHQESRRQPSAKLVAPLEQLSKRINIGLVVALKQDTWSIKFQTESAKQLFKKYYGPAQLKDELPESFMQILDRPSRDFWEEQTRQGKLQISFYEIDDASVLIALEEINSVPSRSPEMLLVLGLTPREAEVLFWVAEGKTSPEIALILNAAPTTIKKHVNHILEKLALENRLSAALLANEILRSSESS